MKTLTKLNNTINKLKRSENNDSLALGLFVDGLSLQAVWLEKYQGQFRLVDAEKIVLQESFDSEKTEKEIESEKIIESAPIDITSEIKKLDALDPDLEMTEKSDEHKDEEAADINPEIEDDYFADDEFEEEPHNNFTIIRDLLNRYPNRKLKIAVSIPEPQLYYSHFDSTWGLSGKKLNKKIVEELLKQKSDSEVIKPETMHNLELMDGSLMSIVRQPEIGLLNIIDTLRNNLEIRMPQVSVVESAEVSLVNLVKENYSFSEEETSVIVYVGNEFSRIIFMKGNKLSHISPIISEGIEQFFPSREALNELANKIRSRLLLEQDNLSISDVDNIILSGGACREEFDKAFHEWFDENVNIQSVHLLNLENLTGENRIVDDLPNFAVPLGAAWRAIDLSNNNFYHVDLIPFKIREEQKVLKLGAIGWTLFVLIPLLTFFFTVKIIQFGKTVDNMQNSLKQKQSELSYLQDLNTKLEIEKKKYNYYVNTFGVLDSLVVGTYTWSTFLKDVTEKAEHVGKVWITEISKFGKGRATLKGYAMNRNKIPAFSDSLQNSVLKQVLIQEINNKTVFSFEIEAEVRDRRPDFKKMLVAEAVASEENSESEKSAAPN